MVKIIHRFLDHQINPQTETLILGTFNPETPNNEATFFYGRQRNHLWRLLPAAYGHDNLKGATVDQKLNLMRRYRIDFADLIAEIEVDEGQEANYDDAYIDGRVKQWNDIEYVIRGLPNLKRVGFTRKTLTGIPHMKSRITGIGEYCALRNIVFQALITPSRFYREDKQTEWTRFLNENTG